MADTGRRKDLIYPTNDAHKLKGNQFDSKSTGSASSTTRNIHVNKHNGKDRSLSDATSRGRSGKSASIQVVNGFSSEDDSDDSDANIVLSQSCGQAELKKLKTELQVSARRKSGGNLADQKFLSGKYVEVVGDEDATSVDRRVQSTYTLFTKGKSLPRKQVSGALQGQSAIKPISASTWRRTSSPSTSKSNQSSPAHMSTLQPSVSGKIRSPSPEIGKRIQSNPFFVQDRDRQTASLTIVNALKSHDRKRLGSAPANSKSASSVETKDGLKKSQSSDFLDVVSADGDNSQSPKEKNRRSSDPKAMMTTKPQTSSSPIRSSSSQTSSPVRGPLNPAAVVNIQSRIKLWAEKEKEAKEIKEQDKKKIEQSRSSSSQKGQPAHKEDSTATMSNGIQPKKSGNVLKRIEASDTSVNAKVQQGVKQNKTLPQEGKQDVYSSSSSLGSPSRSPVKSSRSRSSSKGSKDSSGEQSSELSPKRSRWKLRSPIFSRKKSSNSESMDSEQSDENVLSSNKISSRSSKKRKAIKKRLSSTFGISRSNSESQTIDDQALVTSNKVAHELRQRSNSVGPSSRRRVNNKPTTTSQPDITRLGVDLTPPSQDEGDYMVVSRKQLDPRTETVVVSPQPNGLNSHNDVAHTVPSDDQEDTITDLPSVFIRPDRGRAGSDVKDHTISRDIRDIIDSLGTGSLDRKQAEVITEEVLEEASESLESLPNQVLTPGSPLNVIVQPPTDGVGPPLVPSRNPGMLYVSGDSGSDEDGCLPRGNSISDCSPIQSSLDIGQRKRAVIKRRLSDSSKAIHSTKLSSPKIAFHPRTGSLSPTDNQSDGVIATALMYADAVWDRIALEDDELSFTIGNAIEILDMTDDVWWYGSVDSSNGWFPASFVRLRIGQDSDEDDDSVISTDPPSTPTTPHTPQDTPQPPQSNTAEPPKIEIIDKPSEDQVGELTSKALVTKRHPSRQQSGSVHRRMTIRRKDSAPSQPRKLTSAEVRAKVIEEIVNTERDYVRHLDDIIEGYVKRCRGYNKLFDDEKVDTIFSNVEAIYSFQKDFLRELEASIQHDRMEDSQIGEVFVNNRHEFDIYCEYCNNHPHAVNEMNMLQENEQYTFFFESCRLLRNLQDISLEGFLLTPVQKICKYPLQLTELLKYTSEDHPDHAHVVAARDAMKEVAMHINEHKRRMENIGKIGRWQGTIEGWKGEDILQSSSQMLRCGELHKISKGRSQERHFFLFDHQLVYCKKDTIGGKLTFKGRVSLDQCQITDMEDGTAMHSGSVVKNAWRMNNKAKDNKWYIIFAKSPEEKRDWMETFKKEREIVKEDEEKRFHVPLKMKRAAVSLSANADKMRRGRRKSTSAPVKSRVALVESVDSATKHKIETSSSNTLGRKLAVSTGGPQLKGKNSSKKKRTS